MKRVIAYIVVLLGMVAIIFWARIYQKRMTGNSGYLGKEVVYFNDAGKNPSKTGEDRQKNDTTIVEKTAQPKDTLPAVTGSPSAASSAMPTKSPVPRVYDKIIRQGKVKAYDTGTVVIGNSAYELYSYVDSTAKRYAAIVNKLTKRLGNRAKVYTMIAPTSAGIILPDNKRDKVNTFPQDKALDKLQKKLSGREIFVSLYDKLMQHRKEYIYFRTDHHWTSLGAYYAYESFCEKKGITPNALSSYTKKTAKGFMGTFYGETNYNKALKKDSLISYYPLSDKLSMKYTTAGGVTAKAPVIADAKKYSAGLKYCAYIAGDNPYTVIRNKKITEKTSCIVVKESYGNAFVPYLTDHYQTVYVIDYRYWEGNLTEFVKRKKCKDVILINNISMTRNSYLVGKMAQIVS